ncbi:thiamine diphosphokinase [uncultured Senegalimassilia sp.]|uniref:thiamine diphosphokinase n=1 Tax=uncultured Senegalimassilia sp. TaxID=1714350 RepID=UPI0027DBD0C5|nr:thiamine diphosphokinase [uncultured Senegalimassilia sp.]
MTTCALVGATYFNEQDFTTRYNEGFFDFVIAVDGGFAPLDRLGVAPDMAVGDFDSLGYVPRAKRVSRHPVNKDASDMELALQRAANYHHSDIYIYGGIGGRLDHTLANLQLFAAYSERGFYVTGIADGFAIRCVTGPDVFTLPDNVEKGTVSVFAANDRAEGVIERGLEYSLDDEPLTNRTSLGLSNELIGEEATIAVESGTLYVFYPLPGETSEQPGI